MAEGLQSRWPLQILLPIQGPLRTANFSTSWFSTCFLPPNSRHLLQPSSSQCLTSPVIEENHSCSPHLWTFCPSHFTGKYPPLQGEMLPHQLCPPHSAKSPFINFFLPIIPPQSLLYWLFLMHLYIYSYFLCIITRTKILNHSYFNLTVGLQFPCFI